MLSTIQNVWVRDGNKEHFPPTPRMTECKSLLTTCGASGTDNFFHFDPSSAHALVVEKNRSVDRSELAIRSWPDVTVWQHDRDSILIELVAAERARWDLSHIVEDRW